MSAFNRVLVTGLPAVLAKAAVSEISAEEYEKSAKEQASAVM